MEPLELPAWNDVLRELLSIGIRICLAAAVVLFGRWLARTVRKGVVKALDRTDLTPSMNTIFVAVAYYGIWLLAIMTALLVLGVPNAVVLTSVGIVVIILAFSLQQSLHDLAAAVIFMLFKPFKLGDLIETKETTGTVEDIGPFATTLVRWDGKVVVLPNAQIQESGIINYSTKDSLMTDLMVRIRFGDDVERARLLILDLLAADPRALTDPAPHIPVLEEGDSWVLLNVRAGVLLEHYWDLQDSMRERIRTRLEEQGIAVPLPLAEVRLASAAGPGGGITEAA